MVDREVAKRLMTMSNDEKINQLLDKLKQDGCRCVYIGSYRYADKALAAQLEKVINSLLQAPTETCKASEAQAKRDDLLTDFSKELDKRFPDRSKLGDQIQFGKLNREDDWVDERGTPMTDAKIRNLDMKSIRKFSTGATRDTAEGKPDYEGFLSPLVIERFGEYMHKNRLQADGKMRDADNWQKGIPKDQYMKSLWRHFQDLWIAHRGWKKVIHSLLADTLCAILFNTSGYLHEILKEGRYATPTLQYGDSATMCVDAPAIADAPIKSRHASIQECPNPLCGCAEEDHD